MSVKPTTAQTSLLSDPHAPPRRRVDRRELEAVLADFQAVRGRLREPVDAERRFAVWMLDTRIRRIVAALWRLDERPDHWAHVDLSELVEEMPPVTAALASVPNDGGQAHGTPGPREELR
jgi:hypothetical protein